MLDFVKKLLGLNKTEVQAQPAKEPVLDAIDMTTKVDGIGHEAVQVAKKAQLRPLKRHQLSQRLLQLKSQRLLRHNLALNEFKL